jgi:hypothetical protein
MRPLPLKIRLLLLYGLGVESKPMPPHPEALATVYSARVRESI